MTNLLVRLRRTMESETGQALGEFSLVLAFIAAVCVAVLAAIGVAILAPFQNLLGGFG